MSNKEKILLVLLPYWSPLIPPLGISCLKSYLCGHGYDVTIRDANTEKELEKIYNRYFDTLKSYVPGEKQGNFYNLGNYVWQDHMMAYLNYKDKKAFVGLVRLLIWQTFFVDVKDREVDELNKYAAEFYTWLEGYFIALLEREKPTVLGLSVYSGALPASVFAFKLTRERYPVIKTVMGGGVFAEALAPGSANLDYFLDQTRDFIDTIIIGEGEQLFLKMLRRQLPPSQRVYTLKDIDREVLDLSQVDIPDYADLNLPCYPYLASYTGRSCPFQCGFCSETVQWGPYRRKSAGQVVKELNRLSRQHNCRLFLMGDSLLNPIVTELARECLNENCSIYWDGYLRADRHACDPGNAALWRQGGFYRARLGVESGSPRVLKTMGKKITVEQIRSAVSNLAAAGIKATTYWVVGYPEETEADFQHTLDLIEQLKDDIYEADCNPFTYFPIGQVNSNRWAEQYTDSLLYPEEAAEMLWVQTWIINCRPHREEMYKRLNRFVRHCARLGIPNPYSLRDIYQADERWKKLHPNSVPPLLEFLRCRESGDTEIIDEVRNGTPIVKAQNIFQNEEDWGF
jgi:radical SAM superfamily enzyme YgiQ (UPF0313 family)